MVDQLLIRAYSVGVGDCIYVRIPKARTKDGQVDNFHMLIDCGSRGSASHLEKALELLKPELPDDVGKKKRLDLLLISHEHEDHISGMDPRWFADMRIENLWMSVAMDRNHPRAKYARELHDKVGMVMNAFRARKLALSPALQEIVDRYDIKKRNAVEALLRMLPASNGIEPLYVHADTPAEKLKPRTLTGATLKVLGPEFDIDTHYLGKIDGEILHGLTASTDIPMVSDGAGVEISIPANITDFDFRRLKSRMMSAAFAFADMESEVVNNTSVILLIEWRGRRLLFVGDAEWKPTSSKSKNKSAWATAWSLRKEELNRPVDFLKIGHHGSINATPWDGADSSEPREILDAILPRPPSDSHATAQAIVSTARTDQYPSIPDGALLAEIGRRVAGTRIYRDELTEEQLVALPHFQSIEKHTIGLRQPWRTDLERLISGRPFVEVAIDPAD